MSGREPFERVLGALHEAALDDALWPAASGLLEEACGTKGNMLAMGDGMDRDDIQLYFIRLCCRGQRRPDLERLYLTVYHPVDERLPRLRRLPDSQLTPIASLYDEEEKKTSITYNEGLPLGQFGNALDVRMDGPRGSRITWTVADPVDADGWSGARVRTIERLLPHVRQFARVRQALVDAGAMGASAYALLENTHLGVVHLDRRGRIVSMNGIAREVLRRGDGLADRKGSLFATSTEDDTALQRMLAGALPPYGGGPSVSGSVTLRRAAMAPRLWVHVHPLDSGRADERPSEVAALLLVVDAARRGAVDPAVIRSVFGLTAAESRVAALLARGLSPDDVAVATGRSKGTVRWHLQSVFRKMGVSRQAELASVLQSLSGIEDGPI